MKFLAAILLVAWAATAQAAPLIELYTAQGCASCPPADAILGEVARDPGVVALTLPVDYWDFLGWKDTLALPAFSRRQRAYAVKRGEKSVYTPEIIVEGTTDIIGDRRQQILDAITQAKSKPDIPIVLTRGEDGVHIEIGSGSEVTATIWAARFVRHKSVSVGHGENSDKTLDYWNVARDLQTVEIWHGTALSLTFPMHGLSEDDGVAVFLQQDGDGPILGAAKIDPR